MCMELKMKKIENFGDLIISNLGWVAVLLLSVGVLLSVYDLAHTVKISDKEFYCGSASPDGLGTKCDTYIRRVK